MKRANAGDVEGVRRLLGVSRLLAEGHDVNAAAGKMATPLLLAARGARCECSRTELGDLLDALEGIAPSNVGLGLAICMKVCMGDWSG